MGYTFYARRVGDGITQYWTPLPQVPQELHHIHLLNLDHDGYAKALLFQLKMRLTCCIAELSA